MNSAASSPTTTSNAVAVRNSDGLAQQDAALAIYGGQNVWTPTQEAALVQLGLAEASDGDRSVFLHQCQRTGLDPFARQIYMIPRKDKGQVKWTIQTGIDGLRVMRDRAERKAGVRGILSRAVFYDTDGNEYRVWFRREPPVACEITYTVIDADGRETPYTSILRFTEYCQYWDGKPIAQWATKPTHMLEKCTEADVYRKAFPQDFSGVHLDDAMPRDGSAPQAEQSQQRQRATAEQIRQARQTVPSTLVGPADDTQNVPPAEASPQAEPAATRQQAAGGTRKRQEPKWPTWATDGIQAQAKRLGLEPDEVREAAAALLPDGTAPDELTGVLAEFTNRGDLIAALAEHAFGGATDGQ
jgi:phage recombination protein Bet